MSNTKELIVDYRKRRAEQAPINIDGAVVSTSTTNYNGPIHTKTVMKRAHQNIFPLRRLKRFGMGPQILKRFYSCT